MIPQVSKRLRDDEAELNSSKAEQHPSNRVKQSPNLLMLPDEVLGEIFTYIVEENANYRERMNCLLVCRKVTHIMEESDPIWQVMRVLRGKTKELSLSIEGRIKNCLTVRNILHSIFSRKFFSKDDQLQLNKESDIKLSNLFTTNSQECKNLGLEFLDLDKLDSSTQSGNEKLDHILKVKEKLLTFGYKCLTHQLTYNITHRDKLKAKLALTAESLTIAKFINDLYEICPEAIGQLYNNHADLVKYLASEILSMLTGGLIKDESHRIALFIALCHILEKTNINSKGDYKPLDAIANSSPYNNSEEALIAYWNAYPTDFASISDHLRFNRDFVLKVIKNYLLYDLSFEEMSMDSLSHFNSDLEVIIEMSKHNSLELTWVDSSFLQDRKSLIKLISADISLMNIFGEMPKKFEKDKEFMYEILKETDAELRSIPPCVSWDRELFFAFLKLWGPEGRQLKYYSDPFAHVPEEIMQGSGFFEEALRINQRVSKFIPEKYRANLRSF